jgi:SpoVK/Ycf46/Vps4 family AAA+-type ATPase
MAFLLDQTIVSLERGLEAQRRERVAQARQRYLRAAEMLFKAASLSPEPLKSVRLERAEDILRLAEALPPVGATPASPQASAGRGSARGKDEAEKEGPTSGQEWLLAERPNLKLADVAGLDQAKEQIRLRMIYPFAHPELAARYGIKRGGGILMYGPPGTGKTMLARAVAGEIDAAFFTVKPSEVMSKWVGEAEQNVSKLFQAARSHPRSIMFIDEVEALMPRRRESGSTVMQRVVPQFLQEMEGLARSQSANQALLFMGATNEPWSLDEAALRPGRLDEKIYIPLPDYPARLEIVQMNLKGKPLAAGVNLEEVARLLEGYSGADIRHICERATQLPFLDSIRTGQARDISMGDIKQAISEVKPSVTPRMLERFERWAQQAAG